MTDNSEIVLSLSGQDKSYLLALARKTILSKAQKTSPETNPPDSKVLKEKRGAFVTLNSLGKLRGCIGYIEGIKSLYLTIIEMAEAAAFDDSRFAPVQTNEIGNLEIEISVLTPLRTIQNIDDIKIGVHGLLIQKGVSQGLLLPQVAAHYNWDRDTFLDQTCLKAGLPAGRWKDSDVTIKIFSAQIFSESQDSEKYC